MHAHTHTYMCLYLFSKLSIQLGIYPSEKKTVPSEVDFLSR